MAIINGKVYDWGDITISIPGLSLEVQEISYDDELEKEVAYGKGQRPRGYGEGNYKSEGKLSLLRDDYDDIVQYCKSRNLGLYRLVIPKIVVSYADGGGRTRTDVLNTVTFTKASHKNAQGDKSLKVDLDFIIVNGIDRDGVKPI
ncbi:hypothetical protein J6TS7_02890 [Paenibacillus dendritiformis]|uniref:hypothetical protein n=1 Tax=Paenibacillus TaxID=44249 RepID=UPI001B262964|nr:hypothetical protein [Paenibacillus dendritiformis]GIO76679.1 hypothetical protein J6TS7_02890 [Paenibacillus dendritiformis]